MTTYFIKCLNHKGDGNFSSISPCGDISRHWIISKEAKAGVNILFCFMLLVMLYNILSEK